jgi:ribonuclease HII
MPAPAARPGYALLRHDRRVGTLVAGADEAGRGALAGPLVCAAVLFDHSVLRGRRARLLALLNDSKQLSRPERQKLAEAVLATAAAVAVRVVPAGEIDRVGLHRSNLAGLRDCLERVHRDGAVCLVDGFTVGPDAPEHRAIVHGDSISAAIAAASVVAKVTRDRLMQRLDEIHPEYGFAAHVGYITRAHADAVRAHGACQQHRRSFKAACLQ